MKTSIVLILFLPFLMGCYGLSIQNIIANYIQYTPEPPPHDQPAKLARYVMHYSGKYMLAFISYIIIKIVHNLVIKHR